MTLETVSAWMPTIYGGVSEGRKNGRREWYVTAVGRHREEELRGERAEWVSESRWWCESGARRRDGMRFEKFCELQILPGGMGAKRGIIGRHAVPIKSVFGMPSSLGFLRCDSEAGGIRPPGLSPPLSFL